MAEVYDPSIPISENAAYLAKSKILMEEREAQIFGKSKAFVTENVTGWTPPGQMDAQAIQENHVKEHQRGDTSK